MKRAIRFASPVVLSLLVSACGGGPVRRINPPSASIQQLSVQADGRWQLELRLQNYSTVPMTFTAVDLDLAIEGHKAGKLSVSPGVEVPGESADVVTVLHSPPAGAEKILAVAARDGNVGYTLRGGITTREPDKRFDLDQASQLSPVPGRPDTYR
ncbi:LEA type 2 family protein [Tahibacter amnicola]|uniref:LEA type 2 family protein n=1 Tax=Tahibacter amnicola TaxID=2976241 RepID=A0ABY6BIJ1_9GAMM|nr:LEA type 2 family protein [Tahibacter amnicola]UXI69406.1 LEA type 2 family protein [Tahibacter amnicola]